MEGVERNENFISCYCSRWTFWCCGALEDVMNDGTSRYRSRSIIDICRRQKESSSPTRSMS